MPIVSVTEKIASISFSVTTWSIGSLPAPLSPTFAQAPPRGGLAAPRASSESSGRRVSRRRLARRPRGPNSRPILLEAPAAALLSSPHATAGGARRDRPRHGAAERRRRAPALRRPHPLQPAGLGRLLARGGAANPRRGGSRASARVEHARRRHGAALGEGPRAHRAGAPSRSEEHTSELQSPDHLVCRLLLEKKKMIIIWNPMPKVTYLHRITTLHDEHFQDPCCPFY